MTTVIASEKDVANLVDRIVNQLQNDDTIVAMHDDNEDVKLVQEAMKIVRTLLAREASDGEEDSIWQLVDLVDALRSLNSVKWNEQMDADSQPSLASDTSTDGGSTMEPTTEIEVEATETVATQIEAAMAPVLSAIMAQTTALLALAESLKPALVIEVDEETEAAKPNPFTKKDDDPEDKKDGGSDEMTEDDPEDKKKSMMKKASDEDVETVVASEEEEDDGEELEMTQSVNASYEAPEEEEDDVVANAALRQDANEVMSQRGGLGISTSSWQNPEQAKSEYLTAVAKANRIPVGVVDQPGQITKESPINMESLLNIFRR